MCAPVKLFLALRQRWPKTEAMIQGWRHRRALTALESALLNFLRKKLWAVLPPQQSPMQ
jgi:hypothetical protein